MNISNDKEYIKARNYALRLLTYRMRSESELISRLKQKKYSDEVINDVVNLMKEYNYINDGLFAAQWVEYRTGNRPRGKLLIKQELKNFGIAEEIIAEAISSLDRNTEIMLAKKLAEKKIKSGGKVSARSVAGLLQRRGFAYDIVREVLSDFKLI